MNLGLGKQNTRGSILIYTRKEIDKKAIGKISKYNLEYPIDCIMAKANICIDKKNQNTLQERDDFVYDDIIRHAEWNR